LLFVHIGTHKTGTSALQSALTHHADNLLENGVRYIKAGREDAHAHHKLAQSVRGKKGIPLSSWAPVRAELDASTSPVNLLSSEGFSFAPAEGVRKELGSRTDVRIVLYLRRQDKYLQSLYKQGVAGGRTPDFDAWLERHASRGDYLALVSQWAEHFGRDAIVLRPYERNGKTIDLVEDFMGVLGCDSAKVMPRRKPGAMRNPSPRRELMELWRAFNQTGTTVDREKLFFSIMKGKPEYARSADLLDFDGCRNLMARYADANRELIETYYRDSEVPLFPELVRGTSPDFWQPGQPEYFNMLVDVMSAVVKTVSGAPAAGEQKRQGRKKPSKKRRRDTDA